ncbi:MAG: DUF2125 domain-containing protein [Alphaproteobacteria bacterium]|nr:DUF2125 domain-containing protein [Alphaproteobacteria bacterium]
MTSRRPLLIALLVLSAAVGGYGAYWWAAAAQAERAIDRWIADWRAAGYTVDAGTRSLGGFPGVVTIGHDAVRLSDPEDVWGWRGERLVFEVRPWAPTDYRLELIGAHRLHAPVAGERAHFHLDAARAVGGAEIDLSGRLRRVTVTFDALSLASPDLALEAAAQRLIATLDLPAEPPRSAEETTAELMLTGDGVQLPARYAGPLGDRIERVSARLHVLGPAPQAGLRQTLTAWRDAGGRVETPWLRVGWGPLGLDAEGALSLDEALRPVGAYQARISGLDRAIDRFREAGLIEPGAARLLAGGARLLARAGADGRRYIDMPVTAENGGLFIGPVRVAYLPPVIAPPAGAAGVPPVSAAPAPAPVQVEELPALPAPPPTVSPDFPARGG